MNKKKFYMEKGWYEALKEEFDKPYMINLQNFLVEEQSKGKVIYPEDALIFNAFCETPYNRVKVVIVGQDPYHGKGQAHGLSFSVLEGVAKPPSLQNIFKELQTDLGISPPISGNLLYWAKQGVLLLNATLTVEEGRPLSHYGKGWERFTDCVIEKLIQRESSVVFLLWGKSAQEKCEKVFKNKVHPHLVLKAAHPSFFSAANFFGCRHFSKTNDFLKKANKEIIDWQIS